MEQFLPLVTQRKLCGWVAAAGLGIRKLKYYQLCFLINSPSFGQGTTGHPILAMRCITKFVVYPMFFWTALANEGVPLMGAVG